MMRTRIFNRSRPGGADRWSRSFALDGLTLFKGSKEPLLDDGMVAGFISQLQDDGLAIVDGEDINIPWDSLYAALEMGGYEGLDAALQLPDYTKSRPILTHGNSLTDQDFAIYISGWRSLDGSDRLFDQEGAILSERSASTLMRPEHWALIKAVQSFAQRPAEHHSDRQHRQAWGQIRRLALKANAELADFLWRTVVLSPERLKLDLRKVRIGDSNVIEVTPGFEGAPDGWLSAFDGSREVRERYDLPTPEGIVQVLVSDAVGAVLREIKRMPGRRAVGSRAQAFVLNPYAVLGEGSAEVIDEEQFETAREEAGLAYERFSPVIHRNDDGYPVRIGILIESASSSGPANSESRWFSDAELSVFIEKLQTSIKRGYQLMGWQGYDFELQREAPQDLALLKEAYAKRSEPHLLITYAQVHDLSNYYERVEEIGIEAPYYSPYIAKKKEEEGWFPENVVPLIVVNDPNGEEPLTIPLAPDALRELRSATHSAKDNGSLEVDVDWLPKPIPIREAEHIIGTFHAALGKVENEEFYPLNEADPIPPKPSRCKTLIIRPNIQELGYHEVRRDALMAFPAEPELPSGLNPGCTLMHHQRHGLSWLQHLYDQRVDHQVRGAVLADDMGLGKTFQLLAFMAWLQEKDPSMAPMLVVAPVSLLENWKEEAEKFLSPGVLPMLTAYGSALASLRVAKHEVDERLRSEDGLVKFLKPGWVGNAKVVLTTYETLRDLEFSFAAVKWSFMVCDEAQRIKNPAAMVTRAAKKQNVGFKVACTGTPVENTLADLWCLFDFIQPGLLGALNDFGKRYRKPIEARTEEERDRVEELRSRIAPQILRRSKAEVATGLKSKNVDEACRSLKLSNDQRRLYANAIEDFRRRNEPGFVSPFKNHLGLLHYLRLICTDPRRHGLSVFRPEPLADYRTKAPKLDWLIRQLQVIRKQDEKAIIFCEFREIQRLLQHYIEEAFHYRPDIINGDTTASSTHIASRQKRINAFQERPGFGVLILSPVAVGFGVNIQAANHVIHYTRTWNPAKEDQATDRAYRIGQKKDVHVYYPVVCADDFTTFDVKLDQLLATKRVLATDMLNGSGDLSPGEFNLADVIPLETADAVDELINLDMALSLTWRHLEGLAAALWSKQGFTTCYCTPRGHDNGIDVVCLANEKGVLIQTKASGTEGTQLGWDAIKEVVGGEAYYRRRHPGVDFLKVALTNQYFNPQAQELARLNNVHLIDQKQLSELLNRYPTSMLEIERFIYLSWEESKD
jgi:HJR/Mrr/RecB family endonuclease